MIYAFIFQEYIYDVISRSYTSIPTTSKFAFKRSKLVIRDQIRIEDEMSGPKVDQTEG